MSATGRTTPALRQELEGASPTRFWRSLEDLAQTPGFRAALEKEFPDLAPRFAAATDRRTALKLLGASMLMGGLAACQTPEGIAPYVEQPEFVVPGRPEFYATSVALDGFGMGVLAESHEGRPTKIEGNPNHPASLGGTDPIMQASVFSLYEPDRSRIVLHSGQPSTWGEFQAEIAALRDLYGSGRGAGLGLVVGRSTSPTLKRQLAALKAQMPLMRLYQHDPLAAPERSIAARAVFGRDLAPVYHFDRAEVIVSLGSDFLGEGPGKLAYARAFADGRRVRQEGPRTMNRLYALDAGQTLTGASADHRLQVRPRDMDAIAAELLNGGGGGADTFVSALLADVARAGSRAVFLAGERESAFVQQTAYHLNQRAGAIGATMSLIEPPDSAPDGAGSIHALAEDMASGTVTALVSLNVDVVHSAPGDADIVAGLRRLERFYHHGLHLDGTAQLAHWHVPGTQFLESWSDLRAYEGSASIVQPLIAPLYQGRTTHEVLSALFGDFASTAQDLVRASWAQLSDADWRMALKAGVIAGTVGEPMAVTVAGAVPVRSDAAEPSGLDLVLVPDPYLRDGAHAANLFLQELPRPLSKLTWGNAAEMAPATAAALGLATGDQIEVRVNGGAIALPVMVSPGLAPDTVVIGLGYGRPITRGNEAVGANAFALQMRDGRWRFTGTAVRKLDGTGRIITTQNHHTMEGRDILRELTLGALPVEPGESEDRPTLYPEWVDPDQSWGMSIDLTTCIGCMACVQACQAENNSPVVGPEEMARGHDMHWLRVDRYYSGAPEAPQTAFQPVPCMQCEDAPCEVVCPVNATVHTHDGLNAQVYNRCVGTRYCSQNCPYKVRRFNFFDFQDFAEDAPLSLLMNPDVSVRSRGVMEKCTYCVQRISEARIGSDISDQPIPEGTLQTACQQACPTKAITFGNIKDHASAVAREKTEPRSYAMLAELNTRPRTTYLAKLRNPSESAEDGDG